MATKEFCISAVAKAAGIDKEEASRIVKDLENSRARAAAQGKLMSATELAEEADRLGNQARLGAALKKKQAVVSFMKLSAQEKRVNMMAGQGIVPIKGALALLEGTQKRGIMGGTNSTYMRYESIRAQYLKGIENDIDSIGGRAWDRAKSDPDFSKNVVRELWQLRSDGKGNPGITKDADAIEVARSIRRNTDEVRTRMNDAGAHIRELQGWAPQSHDEESIIKAGFLSWSEYITPLLDLDRMGVHPEDLSDFLRSAYEHITLGKERPGQVPTRITPRNLATSHERSRVLHFRDADAQIEYQDKFGGIGGKNVLVSVQRHIDRSSRDMALMEDWGPNPEHNIMALVDRIRQAEKDPIKRRDLPTGQDVARRQSAIGRSYSVISGEYMIASNARLAQIMRSWRAIQSMSKLGSAPISAVGDVAITSTMLRSINDRNAFSALSSSLKDVFTKMNPAEKKAAGRIGVVVDGALADLVQRFNAQDSARGFIGQQMANMFKWSGLTGWTNARKNGYALLLSRDLADAINQPWEKMQNTGLRESLEAGARLTESEWNILRSVGADDIDGDKFFTPDMVRRVGDDVLSPKQKTDLETRLRSMFIEMTHNAVIEPDARTMRWLTGGERAGTGLGELMRTVMQFKSFILAYQDRVFTGRRWRKAGRNTDVVGMSVLMASMASFGYITMTLKDLANGKAPRDPLSPKTWGAALMQSGGFGIYGDFLFSENNRFGGSVGSTLGGPTLGVAEDLAKMVSKLTHGDPDVSSEMIRLAKSNIPYANLWYTKAATDYLFWYHLREMASPGSIRRMEKRMKKDFNQEFFIPPSTVVR